MKILILSPYYFPSINPRAHRWTSIAEHWAEQGHEVHIICSKNKAFPPTEVRHEVQLHRTGFNSLKEVLYHFSKNESKRGEAGQKRANAGKKGALMQWFNDKVLRNLYFPDDAFMWYRPAKRKAKELLKRGDFDLLISSSVPFTAHLVALYLKKQQPNLKWIADTGDPFAFQPLHPLNNYSLYSKKNEKLEREVVMHANFVSLTNKGAVNLYQSLFPETRMKFVEIPPVLRRRDYISNTPVDEKVEQKLIKIRIGYFGSFFKNIREPRPVLQYFDKLLQHYPEWRETLELHFYGNIFENFLSDFGAFPDLQKNIVLHGMIPSNQVGEEMQKMNILLNVGNRTTFQLPSKSVDYMLSGKPIINFTSLEEDTFSAFFANYVFFDSFKNNEEEENVLRLNVFMRTFRKRRIGKEQVLSMTAEFRAENVAKRYLDLVVSDKSAHTNGTDRR